MMKMVSLKCPECGATLSAEENQKQMFCMYCGAKIMMTNENEHIYRHIDEARIRQAEADMRQAEIARTVRLRELEMAERQRKAAGRMTGLKIVVTILLLIAGIPITGFGILTVLAFFAEYVMYGGDRSDMSLVALIALISLGVGISILSCIFILWRRKR